MSLEVKHNRAPHTHENVQFRRVAIGLKALFKQRQWDGILIGNPESEEFSRFRADAILLYNHGLVIIDFKEYQGEILLPAKDDDFGMSVWRNITKANDSIIIKGGNRFINPFMQLKSYRQVMYEVINSNVILKSKLNPSRTCALNIFSGPIQLNRKTPRSVPYYQLCEEKNLGNFLFDYTSENKYDADVADILKGIFPGDEFIDHIEIPEPVIQESNFTNVESEVKVQLREFLDSKDSGVFLLTSMNANIRDGWVNHLLNTATDSEIPEVAIWSHSTRIKRKIKVRSGIDTDSLYNTIYGGSANIKEELEVEGQEDTIQEVIPLKSDIQLDKKAVIILHEAHLVSRSLHQSDLLRFGSGRLLEDCLKFLRLEDTDRKVICIGDPYSLSYGKENDSALSLEAIKEIFSGQIYLFDEPTERNLESGISTLRSELASSLKEKIYNRIKYNWENDSLIHAEKADALALLRNWFTAPLNAEPENAVLFYKNSDAHLTNLWIKAHCLKNGDDINSNDLLIVNNNININDKTGFGHPTRIYNGMYLKVLNVGENYRVSVPIKQSKEPIELDYIKLNVKCLSIPNVPEVEVLLLNNYFSNSDGLSNEEQIALRVHLSKKVNSRKAEHPFEQSAELQELHASTSWDELKKELLQLKEELLRGEKVKGKVEQKEVAMRKLERAAKKRYGLRMIHEVSSIDLETNALMGAYGWAINVHKSVGSSFQQVILKALQNENSGINNASYYRWLYSGATVANEKLFVLNPQELSPLGKCQFGDQSEVCDFESQKPRGTINFENFSLDEKYNHLIPAEVTYNLKAAVNIFTHFIEDKGLQLSALRVIQTYHVKGVYIKADNPNEQLNINFFTKKDKLSSVYAENINLLEKSLIEEGIDLVFKQPWPKDFREPIYDGWKNQIKEDGYDMILMESHANEDRFAVQNETSFVTFNLRYGTSVLEKTKGFINSINVTAKSDESLSAKLHNWLLDE